MQVGRALAMCVAAAVGCGGGGGGSGPGAGFLGTTIDPNAKEEWKTDRQWKLVASDRCATGPFEIEIPAQEFEFGRRIVVSVHGERGFELNRRIDFADGSSDSGRWRVSTPGTPLDDEHAFCRAKADEQTAAAGPVGEQPDEGAGQPPGNSPPPKSPGESDSPPEPGGGLTQDPPAADAPQGPTLIPYGGHVNLNVRVPYASVAWMPRGWPWAETDIGMSMTKTGKAAAGFRLRLWFSTPTDTQGMVIVVTDQRLVPRGDLISYRAEFDRRVAQAQVELETGGDSSAGTLLAEDERCRLNPDHSWCWPIGRVPPPPRREEAPPAPASNVTWLPGYWTFHRGLDDFVWVEGTFVVRDDITPPASASAEAEVATNGSSDDQPATAPPAPGPTPPEQPAEPVIEEPEPEQTTQTVVVAPTVPARPSAKREIMPRPPAIAGAVWVKGYWELRGNAWAWVKGRWRVPRQRGVRFRAPRIDVKGEVRVYLPGGWVLGR